MSCPKIVVLWIGLGLTPAALLGCGQTPQQADPQQARATLQRALAAWQKGESQQSLKKTSPPVTVVERHWQEGTRLLDYELRGDGSPSGFDAQFSVKLSLQDRSGKKFQEKARYNVSTSPSLVVVRTDGAD